MPDMSQIVITAMHLRALSPEAWEQFVLAVREFSARTSMDMVKCQPDQLYRVQGMAQMAQEITSTLVDAPRLYEKMQMARKQS